jgi:hypothetical protein
MDERQVTMPIGIVVERRRIDHPWAKERWRPVEVVPGAGAREPWRLLVEGDGWARWLAAVLPLELHRKDTEGYRYTLSGHQPALFVVMRPAPGEPFPWYPVHITASAWEAQGHQEFGDDIVEAVAMPEAIVAWVQDFVDRHHVDEPFYKRKRKGRDKGVADTSDFERIDRTQDS